MRLRKTLLAALLLSLLGAYVFFFEFQKGNTGKTQKLLSFKDGEVQGLFLNYPDQEIHLQREARGRWRIVYPVEATADDSVVASVLAALNTTDIKRTIAENPTPADLENFGLNKPEAKVLVSLRNGTALPPISVGARTPFGNSVYIRRGSDAGVLLADASVRSNLVKKLNDLRDKEILSASEDQVARLEIRSAKNSLVLARGEKDDWRVETPKKGKAKQGAVAKFLSLLNRLRATGFADDDATDFKKYGLDSPSIKVSIAGKNGKNLGTLLLGSKLGNEYYAAWEGSSTVYTIDEFSYNQLNIQLNDFID